MDYNEFYYETTDPIQQKIDELKSIMRAEVDEETTHQLEYDKKLIEIRDAEIKRLKTQLSDMSKELTDLKNTVLDDKAVLLIGKVLKDRINKDNIKKFVEFLFDRDDDEFHEYADMELMCNYYSHKEDILNILNYLNIPCVNDIEKFRLPVDYTEAEVEVIMRGLYNISCTNGRCYEDNLRYSTNTLLKPITSTGNWFNLMYQYFLKNPHVMDYIDEIAINIDNRNYAEFGRIDLYQDLSEDDKYVLANSLKPEMFTNKDSFCEWQKFAHRNIQLIENREVLLALAKNITNYSIRYDRKYIGFPADIRKLMYDRLSISELCEMIKDDKADPEYRLEILEYITKKMELKIEITEEIN